MTRHLSEADYDAAMEARRAKTLGPKGAIPNTPPLAPFTKSARTLDDPSKGAKGANTGLAPFSVSLAEVQPEPITWLWPGRVPVGKLTMLDGDPGLGKSTLALDLAARVTKGHPMPDGAPVAMGTVVLLTAEDGLADTVRPRLDAMGADAARVVAVQGVLDEDGGVQSVSLPQHIDVLRQAIARTNATLVIIDPFMAYLGSYINSRIDHDIRRSLAPLAALADETHAAVLLIRHLNKAAGGPALYRGGGSIGLIGAARSGLLVAEDPDDATRRVLAVVKSNLAPKPVSLVYRIASAPTGAGWVTWGGTSTHTANDLLAVVGDAVEQDALAQARKLLRDELGTGPRPTVQVEQAARAAGISERTLNRARVMEHVRASRLGGTDGKWQLELPGSGDGQERLPNKGDAVEPA